MDYNTSRFIRFVRICKITLRSPSAGREGPAWIDVATAHRRPLDMGSVSWFEKIKGLLVEHHLGMNMHFSCLLDERVAWMLNGWLFSRFVSSVFATSSVALPESKSVES